MSDNERSDGELQTKSTLIKKVQKWPKQDDPVESTQPDLAAFQTIVSSVSPKQPYSFVINR